MAPRSSSSSARLLAPAAIAICAVAVLIVIGGSLGGGDDSSNDGAPPVDSATTQTATAPAKRQPATYTVKAGDTLGAIAESTGVPVDTLQELNPELDPQALIAGQKIKLRE